MLLVDRYRSAPSVPIHPWLAPKDADWGKGSSWLASGNQSTDEVRMWEENVFHLALSTGATEFLWWQPGAQRPVGVGQALLSEVLHELDAVTGLAGRAGCTVTPLVTNQTAVEDFGRTWLLSGARVSCHGGHERDVYRFTPREYSRISPRCLVLQPHSSSTGCTRTIECTWWDSTPKERHYPPANGSAAVGWRTGSGWSTDPVCEGNGESYDPGKGDAWLKTCGTVWLAAEPVSTAGAWIVVPTKSDDDTAYDRPSDAPQFDVVVYGASCAGVAAAVAAGQLGMKVGLFEPLPMIGGMCAAGNLALHDSGPAGGLGEVYAKLNAEYYNVTKPISQPESFVSVRSLNTMLKNASVTHVRLDCHLTAAAKAVAADGTSKVKSISVACEEEPVTATVFIDASYDGEVMLAVGDVEYTAGRESIAQYDALHTKDCSNLRLSRF